MEFKVGDRVRIREDLKENEEYDGTWVDKEMLQYVGKIATIKWNSGGYYRIDLDNEEYAWVEEFFDIQHEVIALKNDSCEIPFEDNPKIKTQEQRKIEELEQRIEKLEKEVFKPKETKPSLLTEDERVILRNLNECWKWIVRDEDGFLSVWSNKPNVKKIGKLISWRNDIEILGLSLPFNDNILKFIKNKDEPYNIEELLKGECENE